MEKSPREPIIYEENREREEKKKRELIKRMYPPALYKLDKKPTERELAIDRAKPKTERKFYPFDGEPTHTITYKTEAEIDALMNKKTTPQKQVLKSSSKV